MNRNRTWMALLGAGSLLVAGVVAAQQTMPPPAPPSPPPAPQSPLPPAPPPGSTLPTSQAPNSAVFQTPQGELTVRSTLPPATAPMPPPPFAQLSGGGKWITPDQATAFPLLANDFDYADSNRDHRISASEYARWSKAQ